MTALEAGSPPVALEIQAESAPLESAATEYRALWEREGASIVATMERVSGLRFRETSMESARKGQHDYQSMWATALARDSTARANKWRTLREDRQRD